LHRAGASFSLCLLIADAQAGPFREALSSLCKVSSVEIITKSSWSAQTYTKLVTRGVVVKKGSAETHRALGTTVIVRDFFCNVPVRRKQLIASQEMERVKQTMERIALVHPHLAFSLYNLAKGTKILQTRQVSVIASWSQCSSSSVSGFGCSFVLGEQALRICSGQWMS